MSSSSSAQPGAWTASHCGLIGFEDGRYVRIAGTANWDAQPIPGFGAPVGPPLGQIRIVFRERLEVPYVVLVTPSRTTGAPHLGANYGAVDETGFTVHLFDAIMQRTLQNGGFSFAVLVAP